MPVESTKKWYSFARNELGRKKLGGRKIIKVKFLERKIKKKKYSQSHGENWESPMGAIGEYQNVQPLESRSSTKKMVQREQNWMVHCCLAQCLQHWYLRNHFESTWSLARKVQLQMETRHCPSKRSHPWRHLAF